MSFQAECFMSFQAECFMSFQSECFMSFQSRVLYAISVWSALERSTSCHFNVRAFVISMD